MIHTRPSKNPPKCGPFAPLAMIVRRKVGLPEDDWGTDRRLEEAFPSVALPPDHPFAPYEGHEQNDANVIGCAFETDAFTLTLDHYNVERLAAVVLQDGEWRELGLRWFQGRFPVTIRFEGVREIHVIQDSGVGPYRKLRSSLDGLSDSLWDVVALRCVGFESPIWRFHLEINTHRRIEITPGHGIVPGANVFLECERVRVSENLRQNWIDSVGEDSLFLFEALDKEGPIQGWNVPDFERFVANQRSSNR